MAKKLYEEADIQAIASAIRGKNGTTETYKTSEMADAITNLPTSGGSEPVISALEVTENGTYTAPEGVDGYSPVTVNVPTSGGSSGGVIVNRANPLPMCLPYHHQTGTTGYQYHYLTFIWPAGVEQLYLNHDYATSSFTTSDSYKMSEITIDFGGNLQLVVPSSLTVPSFYKAPAGSDDFIANPNPQLKRVVSNSGKLGNANSTLLNFKFTLKASSYLEGTPTEDTVCILQVSTKGYGSSASMIGILTVQEEAFE